MKESSQIQPVDANAPGMPEWVRVAMSEIAENMQEGLLTLAVGAGSPCACEPLTPCGSSGLRRQCARLRSLSAGAAAARFRE
jgi:hypothetical protein